MKASCSPVTSTARGEDQRALQPLLRPSRRIAARIRAPERPPISLTSIAMISRLPNACAVLSRFARAANAPAVWPNGISEEYTAV